MSKQLGKHFIKLMRRLKQCLSLVPRDLMTAFSIMLCVLLLRYMGLLQSVELAALDQFFRLRPYEQPDNRITIVAVDEASLRNGFPIPDSIMAELLRKLQANQPRAIGLDIYRDLPSKDGNDVLINTYKLIPNLIGTQLLANNQHTQVPPPRGLNSEQVGFNNLLYDIDGKVRRSLLYWHIGNTAYESFALKLALLYLKSENIFPTKGNINPEYLQLNKSEFIRFQENDGAYVRADARGYQILSNFPKPSCDNSSKNSCPFRKVSMIDVLANKVPKSWIQNKIILIGSTAPSIQDFVFIPYSSDLIKGAKPVPGIEVQAYFVSQIISAALEGRPILQVWSKFWECLWIFIWCYLGAVTAWRIRHAVSGIVAIFVACTLLFVIAYLAFLSGWWIPLIPSLLAFTGSVIWITNYLAHIQEELKRSKEFLQQVIDTIADPIFVKNEKHQWIILNDAYCRFIGYPDSLLIEKSEFDFFPRHEAEVFREQDELVFQTQKSQENEEEFTDAYGQTHLIATKRSLHKDAAGNFFLVGVIRDITQRKLLEEQLKRTAAELSRSNNELKLKEDHLRYLAYHDPLTGLPNRKYFAEQLYESINWAKDHNLLLGLLFIDLDGFKQVNDNLGHEIGDRLLLVVAQRLNNSLRTSDIVARLGGDEFTVILRPIPNVQVAAKVAEKILLNLTEPIVLNGSSTRVSASIGISIYPDNSLDPDTLLKQADAAMYRAKHLGKNRVEFT